MTFEEYQKETRETAIYPNKDNNFVYPVLGLVGEAGEVAEKIKKVLRDNNLCLTRRESLPLGYFFKYKRYSARA